MLEMGLNAPHRGSSKQVSTLSDKELSLDKKGSNLEISATENLARALTQLR